MMHGPINIRFNENAYSGSQVVTCGPTNGQTDKEKLIVAFRNFANAPKKKFQVMWAVPQCRCFFVLSFILFHLRTGRRSAFF